MIDYHFEKKETFSDSINELYYILTLLRSKDGCPWDRKQTCNSVVKSLIEETYEYISALKNNDQENEAEEIGDVLLNVLMIIQIHESNEDFTAVEAINSLCQKLVRRHPHVFTNSVEAADETEVRKIWNDVKTKIEGHSEKNGIFDKINKSAPILEQTKEIQKVLKKNKFEWSDEAPIFDKVLEELKEVKEAENFDDKEAEIGDLLFSVINLARFNKIDPSIALYRTNEKIKNRFTKALEIAKEKNISIENQTLEELDKLWEASKKTE